MNVLLLVCFQIIFEGKKAIGVLIKRESGDEKVVLASKEIILSGGTVGTTKLLLLSGVGPKAHLQELKVNCLLLLVNNNNNNNTQSLLLTV